jgi:transcriptional regulator with XRE-family HTH domain
MTKTQEFLKLAADRLSTPTDYKLAQALGIDKRRISDYKAGCRQADTYAAAQIALAIGRDPLEVIAEIEAENAKTTAIREFWRSFSSGRLLNVIAVGLLAASGISGGELTNGGTPSNSASHNVRLRQTRKHEKSPRRGFFLACCCP